MLATIEERVLQALAFRRAAERQTAEPQMPAVLELDDLVLVPDVVW